MKTKYILVVGTYAPDQLESMERYAKLLVKIYQPHGYVRLVRPPVIASGLPGIPISLRKYFAYIDKLIIFPIWLLLRGRAFDLVHIADHGYAYYSLLCPQKSCIVTCHDLLAVRGAMGDASSACNSSPIGIWLQRLIMAGLHHSERILFVSQATLGDYQRLGGAPTRQRITVVPNPINTLFTADQASLRLSDVERDGIPKVPFILMVGSGHPRKNRALALKLLENLGERSPYKLVFAGAPLSPAEEAFCHSNQFGGRIVSIVGPSHDLLNKLYCQAHALLFPSFSEGFGWPLIEAQACGCPVIASTTTSIPEVAGEGALYATPTDVASFAAHVRALEDPGNRAHLLHLGFKNALRFSHEIVANAYYRFAFQRLAPGDTTRFA